MLRGIAVETCELIGRFGRPSMGLSMAFGVAMLGGCGGVSDQLTEDLCTRHVASQYVAPEHSR